MKRLFILLVLATLFASCAKDTNKVLLFIRDGSADLEYMLTKEVFVMKKMLEQSGFEVTVATVFGEPISTDSVNLEPNLKLGDVNTADYAGLILPCMAAGLYIAPEAVAMVKKAAAEGKPVAAQLFSVVTLAEAGVLVGKKYALLSEVDVNRYPVFKGSFYSGTGVIQDGNIITSGVCPFIARRREIQDGTEELTRALIDAIRARTK